MVSVIGLIPVLALSLSTLSIFIFTLSIFALAIQAQTVHVGAGSYTTTLPTGAAAPSNQIFNTTAGPKPTHRVWTAKNWYADNIVNGTHFLTSRLKVISRLGWPA
jgi:hypothetical protein